MNQKLKRDASSRWSFRPNSTWSSIVTTTIEKTHLTLEFRNINETVPKQLEFLSQTRIEHFNLISDTDPNFKTLNLNLRKFILGL